ncbi:MAG: phenylacetate-CoA oxygenase subunit PaaC [Planctomycetes bacterium]|nr:phenylacetate-CoA oxygenase subunit PaaC [Planctomycetota bacterium]
METLPAHLSPVLGDLLLAIADDKLLLGHRNSDWTGLAPMLEEDIAFSSLAQDEIAHAQVLYEMAGELLGRDANALAFGRGVDEYRSSAVVEIPDQFDWAMAIVRQLFCDHFDVLRLDRLARSAWAPLAALGARLAAEERIHVAHVDDWVVRLGKGTDESKARLADALEKLAPEAVSLLEPVAGEDELVAAGLYPEPGGTSMRERWTAGLAAELNAAGLELSLPADLDGPGGRRGHHTTHLPELLDEMCEVYRIEPTAAW